MSLMGGGGGRISSNAPAVTLSSCILDVVMAVAAPAVKNPCIIHVQQFPFDLGLRVQGQIEGLNCGGRHFPAVG